MIAWRACDTRWRQPRLASGFCTKLLKLSALGRPASAPPLTQAQPLQPRCTFRAPSGPRLPATALPPSHAPDSLQAHPPPRPRCRTPPSVPPSCPSPPVVVPHARPRDAERQPRRQPRVALQQRHVVAHAVPRGGHVARHSLGRRTVAVADALGQVNRWHWLWRYAVPYSTHGRAFSHGPWTDP